MRPQQALPRALLATLIFASTPSCVRAVGLDTFSLGIVRLCMASLAMTLVLLFQRKLTVHGKPWLLLVSHLDCIGSFSF